MAIVIGIIGCGNMGTALIEGIQRSNLLRKKYRIIACEVDALKRKKVSSHYHITVTGDSQELTQKGEVILLAVKPQEMKDLLREIAPQIRATTLILSIAAGIPTQLIQAEIGRRVRVVRIMPNTPALVGEGVSAIAGGRFAKSADLRIAKEILGGVGTVIELQEKDLDAVTALSGSGPAYFAYWIQALVDGAVREGLPQEVALKLAEQTARGTAILLQKTALSPEELIGRVASKGGTTEAALQVFEQEEIKERIKRAVKAATARSRELSGFSVC